jgi:hypothetical protein
MWSFAVVSRAVEGFGLSVFTKGERLEINGFPIDEHVYSVVPARILRKDRKIHSPATCEAILDEGNQDFLVATITFHACRIPVRIVQKRGEIETRLETN